MSRRATATEIPRQHADAWLAGRYVPPSLRRDPLRAVITLVLGVCVVCIVETTIAVWLLVEIAERMPR